MWKKSSACHSGGCIEVELEHSHRVTWFQPDRPVEGNTVFARVRSTKDPDTVLEFDEEEWAAFVAGVKNGEFDAKQV